MPGQCCFSPIDHHAILEIFVAAALLQRIVPISRLGPFGMRTVLWQETRIGARPNANVVDTNEASAGPPFTEEDNDLVAPVKHRLGLELLVRLEPTRASERLEIQASVLMPNEL